ncbi:MAG: hypothetical protein AAF412_06310 [Pseudomonadota bacterium]
MQIPILVNVLASSAGFFTGGLILKRYADHGWSWDLVLALTIFSASNIVYARVLAHGLAQGAALSSVLHLALMAIAGTLLFGEALGARQLAALALSGVVMWLFLSGESGL